MKVCVRTFFCLFCGLAATTAQTFNRNLQDADSLQEKQSLHQPLSWRFPDPPAEEEPRFPPTFELKTPTAADSVVVICLENSVRVEAKKDLLGTGRPVHVTDLTLGGCPATREDPATQVLIFESELHECGSQLTMAEDSLVYSFMLEYTPSPLRDVQIIRNLAITVNIQCHYPKTHDVSSGLLSPTWSPFSFTTVAEENLHFSLQLMTDDWQFPHPSAHFLLGDILKFEASIKQFHHVPLRVSVDSCVATVVPNIDTVPRYAFLGNKGCLFDSQLTGGSSKFLPQSQYDRLQFQLEAFRFQQDHNDVIYITCSMKATTAASPVDVNTKACSFSNGWREASGIHHVCSCCDTVCGTGSQDLMTNAKWEQEMFVGPITVKDRPLL